MWVGGEEEGGGELLFNSCSTVLKVHPYCDTCEHSYCEHHTVLNGCHASFICESANGHLGYCLLVQLAGKVAGMCILLMG